MSDCILHKQKDRVSITLGRTINIGNFESVRIEVQYGSDLKKGEDLKSAWDRVQNEAENQLVLMSGEADKIKKEKKNG